MTEEFENRRTRPGGRNQRSGPGSRRSREGAGREGPRARIAGRARRDAPRPAKLEVLFKDDWLIVVNKPSGVLSVPGRGDAPVLADLLRRDGVVAPDEPLLMVHRLDRGASGVMVLARSTLAQQRLTDEWHARRVEKIYWALVRGEVAHAVGEIDLPLWIDRDKGATGSLTASASPASALASRDTWGEIDLPLWIDRDKRIVRPDPKRGKPAVTRYRVLERFPDHTLVECSPLTGRLHQIRVHLAAIGHPLAVDPRYGGGKSLMLSLLKPDYRVSKRHEERPLIARLTLHALRLSFIHPRDLSGSDPASEAPPVTFEAPLPKDFRATLNQLRRI